MPKNTVKPEAAEPYSEQTSFGAPIPVVMGTGPMACRLKLSGKILERSGLKANDRIELIAVGDGQILIKKIGEPALALPPKTTKSGMDRALDVLMAETRAFEAEQRAARERLMAYREEIAAEDVGVDGAEPLSEEQVSREEL